MYSFVVSLDPYIMEERDPLKSQAIESSLWELQALQNHILPSVATAAKFINMPLPSVEWDMSKILENSADDVSKLYCDSTTAWSFAQDWCSHSTCWILSSSGCLGPVI